MFFHGARIQRNGQSRCERFPLYSLSPASAQFQSALDSFGQSASHLTLLTPSVHIRINHPDAAIPLLEEHWHVRGWHKRTRATLPRVSDLCQEYIGESSRVCWRW